MKALKKQQSICLKRDEKRTHTRFKTQSTGIQDCVHQYKFDTNIRKKSLRKYDYPFISASSNRESQKTVNKTHKAIQKSVFNQITLYSPKVKKYNTQVEHYHPLKQYFNSFQVQRKFNKIIVFSNLQNKKHKFTVKDQQIRKQKNILGHHPDQERCKTLIDEIFKQFQRFKDLGYTQKKINQYILKYCVTRRKYMINLLMKPLNKKKFANKIDYVFEKKPYIVKQKLTQIYKKINGVQKFIDEYDLRQFLENMEQILIQKNNIKLNELRGSIEQKLEECFIYNREQNQKRFKSRKEIAEVNNFISDLNNIQDHFGKFKNISNLNRSYFNILGKVQRRLRSKVNELIDIKEHKQISIVDAFQNYPAD